MPNNLLSIPHFPQQQPADCLAACSAMVLAYFDISINYQNLLKMLKVDYFGASANNLHYLASLGVQTKIDIRDMSLLCELILDGSPVITLVKTGDLPYWQQDTDHVVVVVGYDDDNIFLNDPAFSNYPISVPNVKFE